jgi:hypothetical protein
MLNLKSQAITRQGINPSQYKVSERWIFLFMERKGLSLGR